MAFISGPPRLINIGTNSLSLYTHGPEPANHLIPVILFVSGVSSDALVWQAVVRELPSIRSFTYDRSGFHNSESSPRPPSAENIALELSLLIKKAGITNPLILVGHSWAGVLIHEYIALEGVDQIAGIVLVDANHETHLQVMNVNDPILWDVIASELDAYAAFGLETQHKLTKAEWKAFREVEAEDKHQTISQKEDIEYPLSFDTLQKKELSKRQPLLGNKPVFVIAAMRSRDWTGLYEAGVARGNGNEAERAHVREMFETVDEKTERVQKEFLKLSTRSKLVFATESGHFVQLTQPDVVVDGVKWIFENLPATIS